MMGAAPSELSARLRALDLCHDFAFNHLDILEFSMLQVYLQDCCCGTPALMVLEEMMSRTTKHLCQTNGRTNCTGGHASLGLLGFLAGSSLLLNRLGLSSGSSLA